MTEVLCIRYEAEGDAETDELGEALPLELGDAEPLDDGLELGDAEGLALKLELGEREALGLALVSGSSALARTLRITSSCWVTNLPEAFSWTTMS